VDALYIASALASLTPPDSHRDQPSRGRARSEHAPKANDAQLAGHWKLVGDAADRIAKENTSASRAFGADAADARLLRAMLGTRQAFASEVEATLQGGRAAILTPESRDQLLGLAERLGLRTFDAHLLIATVQDAARRGERAWLTEGSQTDARMAHKAPATRAAGGAVHASTPSTSPARAMLEHTQPPPKRGENLAGQVLMTVTLALVIIASVAVLLGP
jgi:hypothetical protein